MLERLSIRKEAQEANIDPELVSVERLNERFDRYKKANTRRLARQMAGIWAELDALTGHTTLPPAEHRAKLTNALNRVIRRTAGIVAAASPGAAGCDHDSSRSI